MRDANTAQIIARGCWNNILDGFVHSEMLKRWPEEVKAASSRKSRELRSHMAVFSSGQAPWEELKLVSVV
jgi:hypothetical protein